MRSALGERVRTLNTNDSRATGEVAREPLVFSGREISSIPLSYRAIRPDASTIPWPLQFASVWDHATVKSSAPLHPLRVPFALTARTHQRYRCPATSERDDVQVVPASVVE